VIFQLGDTGDFIYHIEKGTVEIYMGVGTDASVFTEMGPGEVIGLMAIATSSPRLASARAKTEVLCKKISAEPFKQQIAQLPEWVRSVFKDFRARLEHVDKMLHDKSNELRKLKKKIENKQ
jgi:CRP-like cAMP-binding protein